MRPPLSVNRVFGSLQRLNKMYIHQTYACGCAIVNRVCAFSHNTRYLHNQQAVNCIIGCVIPERSLTYFWPIYTRDFRRTPKKPLLADVHIQPSSPYMLEMTIVCKVSSHLLNPPQDWETFVCPWGRSVAN